MKNDVAKLSNNYLNYYFFNRDGGLMRKSVFVLLILLLCTFSLYSDNLLAGSGTGTATTSIDVFADVASSSAINMANVDKVLVIATFTDESTEQAQVKRTHSFRIRDNSPSNIFSGSIERYLQQETTGDKGIGSLVYIFDVSSITSGTRIYTLQHKVDQNKDTFTKATIVAIPLNSDTSPFTQLNNVSASISTPVTTSSTSFTGVSGLSTSSLTLGNGGDILLVASVNTGSNSASANGSWTLQRQYNNGAFQNVGFEKTRSIEGTNDVGIISFMYLLENQAIGDYNFRIAHKANTADVNTLNSTLAAVSLNYDNSGDLRKFNADKNDVALSTTASTSASTLASLSGIAADGSSVLLLGQFAMSSTGQSTANYSLTSSGGSYSTTVMNRFIDDATDSGSGSNITLVNGLSAGSNYNFNLNHFLAASGTTLSSSNSTIIAIQLSDMSDIPLPVTLSSFTAAYINNQSTLNWTTQSESQNSGWNILKSNSADFENSVQVNVGIIDGNGTTSEPSNYSYVDAANLESGQTYWYWLESISYSGASEYFGPIAVEINIQDDMQETPSIETVRGLLPNYPNPFNPVTVFMFNLADNEVAERLEIYNMKGQKIDTIQSPVNPQSWEGKDASGKELASGIYTYILFTNMGEYSRKMVLTK